MARHVFAIMIGIILAARGVGRAARLRSLFHGRSGIANHHGGRSAAERQCIVRRSGTTTRHCHVVVRGRCSSSIVRRCVIVVGTIIIIMILKPAWIVSIPNSSLGVVGRRVGRWKRDRGRRASFSNNNAAFRRSVTSHSNVRMRVHAEIARERHIVRMVVVVVRHGRVHMIGIIIV